MPSVSRKARARTDGAAAGSMLTGRSTLKTSDRSVLACQKDAAQRTEALWTPVVPGVQRPLLVLGSAPL